MTRTPLQGGVQEASERDTLTLALTHLSSFTLRSSLWEDKLFIKMNLKTQKKERLNTDIISLTFNQYNFQDRYNTLVQKATFGHRTVLSP